MTKRILGGATVIGLFIVFLATVVRADSSNRIGVGVNYWKTVENLGDDIKNDNGIDEDGFSYLVSYQYVPVMFLRLEAGVEMFPTDFTGGSDPIWAPQGFIMTGVGPVYGGAGIGIYFTDGEFADAPFYMVRAGLEFELLPRIFLDLNANYRIDDWEKIKEFADTVGTDTIRLGAAVRFGF